MGLKDQLLDIIDNEGKSALEKQVGGSHYKSMTIQPIEFILANKLNFAEGNVIKYICRYHYKGGIEDLDKVIHYVELLKESLKGTPSHVDTPTMVDTTCFPGPDPSLVRSVLSLGT